jgi:phosphoserine phosphatase
MWCWLKVSCSASQPETFHDIHYRKRALSDLYPMLPNHPEYEPGIVDPHCGARPLVRRSAVQVLQAILNCCDSKTLVFDLDSTVLDNGPRNAMIMRDFGEVAGLPVLAGAHARHWESWDARQAMANIGLSAAQIDRHHRHYEEFWSERFFTSDYCAHDALTDGAAHFIARALECGARVVYLTGRPENMRQGTLACFERLGVAAPDGNRVALQMKPGGDGSDDDFKRDATLQLRAASDIAAAFDNEPQHINTYRTLLPEALCVHLFTDHSMRPIALDQGIVSIRDFQLGD